MHCLSLAKGGCLRCEPVGYAITQDTGGHIGSILGEMREFAARNDARCTEIDTRRLDRQLWAGTASRRPGLEAVA